MEPSMRHYRQCKLHSMDGKLERIANLPEEIALKCKVVEIEGGDWAISKVYETRITLNPSKQDWLDLGIDVNWRVD